MKVEELKEKIVGLTPLKARKVYPNIRVVKEEGFDVKVGPEYRPERVNVGIKSGKIVEIVNLG